MGIANDDLEGAARDFRSGILDCARYNGESRGMCFAISSALGSFLAVFYGIEAKLIEGSVGDSNHFWLELPDGLILDPTADQFNGGEWPEMPSVYIGPKPAHYETNSPG